MTRLPVIRSAWMAALVAGGIAGCATPGTPSAPSDRQTSPPPVVVASRSPSASATALPTPNPSRRPYPVTLFRPLPTASLSKPDAARLQAVLEAAVGDASDLGIGASVISPAGTWTGIAGHDGAGASLTTDATFQTGSIAKTIVAAQVMRLAERGRLKLEDPAADHLPSGQANEANGATIRDLLGMRSGIASRTAAGTTWDYQNGDYILLGRVIEGVERRSLGDVLTADILDVSGADGLRFPAQGTVDNAAYGMETDARSMARWGYALFGGRILEPDSLAAMVAFDEHEYGMGVFDFSADFGRPAAGHLGMEDTWSAAMVAFPEQEMVIVTLMNSGDWERTYRALAQLVPVLAP